MSSASPATASPPRRRRQTPEGRRASSSNAVTHGLTSRVIFGRDTQRIEEVAAAFLGVAPRTPAAWEAACLAAEAHLDVLRCDAAMLHLMHEAEDDDATYTAEKASDRKVEFGLLKRAWGRRPTAGLPLQELIYRKYRGPPRNTTRRHVILLAKLAPELETLSRYAASARARRRQAIEELDRLLGGVATAAASHATAWAMTHQ